jgi:multidrug resistance efflux pump
VKAPPLASELTAAIANVESLQQDIAYRRGQLERLTVRAPLGGRIITPDVDLLSGKYLRIGMPIAQIDDTRTARVQVNLPEGDLRYIKVGDRVQVVSWAYSDSTVYGNVVAIGSSAQAMETDQVIRITTELPNEDGALRSQMTGFAKIEGEQMRVWKAYTLFLIRFFQVKVWSWFP